MCSSYTLFLHHFGSPTSYFCSSYYNSFTDDAMCVLQYMCCEPVWISVKAGTPFLFRCRRSHSNYCYNWLFSRGFIFKPRLQTSATQTPGQLLLGLFAHSAKKERKRERVDARLFSWHLSAGKTKSPSSSLFMCSVRSNKTSPAKLSSSTVALCANGEGVLGAVVGDW